MPPIKVPCVAAILTNPAGQILLLQRDEKPGLEFAGWWTLPGGKVEDGEMPDDAIRRELLEEIELDVPLTLWRVYERQHHQEIGGHTIVIIQHVYTGRIDRSVDSLTLNEGQALGYFDSDRLADLRVAYGFAMLLRMFFNREA